MARRKIINKQNATGPWNEIIGLILMGIGFVILLALISYNSSDPSWNSAGGNVRARNWIGPMGAKLADALYQAFGIAALIVPVMIFVIGRWQWDDDESEVSKPKILGLFLMVVAATGWITMISPEKPGSFYWGGFVGQWLMYGPGIGMVRLLGNMGAFVGLVILFTIGLLLGTDYTLLGLVDNWSQARPDSVMAGWTQRLRVWRQGRNPQPIDVVQPRQVYAKFDQRKRANRQSASLGGVRVTVRPGVQTGRHSASSRQEFNGGESVEQAEDPIIRTPEESVQVVAPVQVKDGSRQSAARIPPPPAPAPSATRDQRWPPDNSPDNALDDEPDQQEEPGPNAFEENGSPAQRTVDEMMATASVKRAEVAEEPAGKKAKSKISQLVKNISRIVADYKLPSTEMLTPPAPRSEMAEVELMERARQLAEKCAEFNVSGQVKQISPGPVVTTFEFKPDPGVKYSRITSLVDDLCLALKAESVRIDRIPGKSTVGIEVPNSHREIIRLREVLESKRFHESKSKLTLALGKTIDGSNYVADLTKMPHLLIAGATGAGKSVALNTILISLLYKATPEEVKLILIDPKRLELGLYADIPHLLSPIVTDPKRASYALKWAVAEMESRYKHLASFGVRNIEQYNADASARRGSGSGAGSGLDGDNTEMESLPYIAVIIDELADLMMVSARDVEESITRLAQMARAVGIHLVLATQRPSVDVITGLIKANFPSRISFRVSSKVDSRTIIDSNGAEQLLGQGDMLFLPPGTSRLVRVHGAYVDEKEVKRIADFVRSQAKPAYDDKIGLSEKELQGDEFGEMKKDEKYDEAARIVIEMGRASTSVLQRRLRIGYGRAASIIDMMEREGIVGPEDGSKPRQVLVKADFLERLDQIREEEAL